MLEDTIALLARTPAACNALLRDLPDSWTRRPEAPGTWDVFHIVGHLYNLDRFDWMRRVRHILEHGEKIPLSRVEREGEVAEIERKSLPQLLDDFAATRAASLDQLRDLRLQPPDLERRGLHPVFGVVTLSQLLSTWAAHDLTHLHQISRVMASQYRDAVGPWTAYLGVMRCNGHSD